MTRLKLFLFYTAMAWLSLVQPREGQKMVDAAERDTDRRMSEKVRIAHLPVGHPERVFPPEEPQSEASVGLVLFGALAALSTVGWVALIVLSMLGGWQ